MNVFEIAVDGMHCRSCELTVERRLKKIPGVCAADVSVSRGVASVHCDGEIPTIKQIDEVVKKDGYSARPISEGARPNPGADLDERRPSFWRLVGLFGLVLILGSVLTRLGLFKTGVTIGNDAGFWTAFFIGLVAASSSCIAVSGGLLLSAAAKFNERFGIATPMARMRPALMFVAGRAASYGLLGGTIGMIGKALSPSPFVTGLITLSAAAFMLIMGLDMLHLAPSWLKGLLPRMPKALSHRIMDAEGHPHPLAPALLGAATFFLPCGFTQALQLYALTTGSFLKGALVLSGFALGTAPALLALGWASSSLKGMAGRFFFRFAGALVIVLGLSNIQSGFTIMGYPLSVPRFSAPSQAASLMSVDSGAIFDGTTQVVKMDVDDGYSPDTFTIRAGVPTRWEINGINVGGCISVLQSPQLGVRTRLSPGLNVIDFTAPQPGTYAFSCSMGMFRGQFNVVPNA